MALVTISGFPCSGKSTAARALAEHFTTRLGEPSYTGPKLRVVVVDDESNHVPRSTYDGESESLRHEGVYTHRRRAELNAALAR
jgi:protein KTI12